MSPLNNCIYLLCAMMVLPIMHAQEESNELLVLTVATEENCDFKKFERSVNFHGIPLKVLGLGQEWRGFGWKLSILRDELQSYDGDRIVLVTDSYDVLFNANADEIFKKFKEMDARILFSAESNCWPSDHLCSLAPVVGEGKRLLNAGLYIGYAAEIYEALTTFPLNDEMNDQQYFYEIYVDEEKRGKLNFKLDHKCELFQNFEGGSNDIELLVQGQKAHIINRDYKSSPLIIHTPGHCKDLFNTLAAFVPKLWNSQHLDDILCLDDVQYPRHDEPRGVLISVLTGQMKNDVAEFMSNILQLDYPKELIHLFIRSEEKYKELMEDFISHFGAKYGSVVVDKYLETHKKLSLAEMGFDAYVKSNCSYYFNVNSATLLKDPNVLQLLIEKNRNAIESLSFGWDSESLRYAMFLQQENYCKNSIKVSMNMNKLLIGMF